MRIRPVLRPAVALFISIAVAGLMASIGQTATKKTGPATGSVIGEVSCADTNAPARFAVVTLEPVPVEKAASDEKKKEDQATNATATTDLQGRFALDKVMPGHYYVLGVLAGYLNPLTRFDHEQLHAMTDETRKELAKLVPVVEVEPGQEAAVTLRLERASEIGGTVLYDDGSPAVGLHVGLLRKGKDGKLASLSSELSMGLGQPGADAMTDDRGHYRMIGAPPGEYAVRASLPTEKFSVGGLLGGGLSFSVRSENGGELTVYSGDVFRKKDAKTTKVGDGDQVGGVDITISIAGLHTVRGTVTAKRDGHALNAGQVHLLYADDQEQARYVNVDRDGNFELDDVPEDKYILRLITGADTEQVELHPYPEMTVKQDKVLREYDQAEMPLLVQGDISGLELAAPDLAQNKASTE
jgi:hypothetical protein